MITIISGTDRNNSNTLKISKNIITSFEKLGEDTTLCDLKELPEGIFSAKHSYSAPKSFFPFQNMILKASGIVIVTPEYNGSFPGVLKHFIDLLKFPESFYEMPVGFIGLAQGKFGAIRSIEHLTQILQYRKAFIHNEKAILMNVDKIFDSDKSEITDSETKKHFQHFAKSFISFTKKINT